MSFAEFFTEHDILINACLYLFIEMGIIKTQRQTVEKKVKLARGERIKVNVTIAPAVKELGEVLVTTSGVGRVNQSAFNAVAETTSVYSPAVVFK